MILIVSDTKEQDKWFVDIERELYSSKIDYVHSYFYSNRLLSKLSFMWKIYFRLLIKKHSPKVIVFIQHYGVRNHLIGEARRFNIPTVELQHGVIYPNHKYYFLNHDKHCPDYLIVYSDYEKELLEKDYFYRYCKIKALGCPRYDKFVNCKPKEKIMGNVFWAAQDNAVDFIDEYIKIADENPKLTFYIKFHPMDKNRKKLTEIIKSYKTSNVIVIDKPIEKIIPDMDLVIYYNSTVGFESVLMGVPVYSFDTGKFIDTKDRKEFIKKRLNNFGMATYRIVGFLSERF